MTPEEKEAARKKKACEDQRKFRERHGDKYREYHRAQQRALRAKKPEQTKAARERFKASNPDKMREYSRRYYSKKSEQIAATNKAWREKNPHMSRYYRAQRRALEIRATPVWADMDAIAEIYRRAKELGMEVDHIIPLNGKNVCGLHVPANLQLLTQEENRQKSNRFESA